MQTARRQLKHWLVPHKGNHHHPHLIRVHGLAMMVVVVLGLQIGWNWSVTGHPSVLGYASDITVAGLVTQTNQERTANNLLALHEDSRLDNAASMKAQDMFTYDYWAHVSPSGVQPWYWFGKAGYIYEYAGENLAKDFDTTSGVMAGWMGSPEHKANILDTSYTDFGFAVMNGTLQGEQTTLVVAEYGSQASTPAANVQSSKPTVSAARPISTPVPTVAPAVTPIPEPSKTPTPTVAGAQTITQAPNNPKTYSALAPLAVNRTLGWAAWLTLLLLLAGFVVSMTTTWAVHHLPRKSRRVWYRHHSFYTGAVFVAVAAAIIVASFGSVT
jgi:uncharacterized protein YkwD